jgi:hypothetical protein
MRSKKSGIIGRITSHLKKTIISSEFSLMNKDIPGGSGSNQERTQR